MEQKFRELFWCWSTWLWVIVSWFDRFYDKAFVRILKAPFKETLTVVLLKK